MKRRLRNLSMLLANPLVIAGELVIIVALIVGIRALARQSDGVALVGEPDWSPQSADFAPDFTLNSIDGKPVSLADFRGRVVLLNFWASWCPPCRAEMPDIQAYYEAHRQEGFEVLAVNVREDAAQVRAFFDAYHIDLPVLMDPDGAVYDQYEGGSALPRSYLIGPDGSLVNTWRPGMINRASLDEIVSPLLGS